jgi:hypothetical protein
MNTITPQAVLAISWAWLTVIPWIAHLTIPKKPWDQFVGKQIAHAIKRGTLAIILYWGGFW